ncbi:hypothetical protein [Rhodoferax sp.]|uniref:hypothetical protein n=1 Tax=Rhodoferax sp. TaxID=50421 RepID=UPI001EC49F0D|nr:hypothetical protein [Rhodoferax sp.]MBT9508612.1 hypothetical protein [Rhodoferax sp.]
MRWLDRIPLYLLILVAAWMAVAPITPEPHLVEKVRMLLQGTLTRPIDIFDLLYHVAPMVLLALRVWRMMKARELKE